MQERTQKPSTTKLKQAKKRGEIATSSEFAASLVIVGSLLLIWGFSSTLYRGFSSVFIQSSIDVRSINVEYFLQHAFISLLIPMIVLLGAIFVLILVAYFVQTGWIWTFKRRRTNNNSRFYQSLFIFLKISLSAVGGYLILRHQTEPYSLFFLPADIQISILLKKIFIFLMTLSLLQLFLGMGDFFYKKWRHYKDLHMTRQEQKEELRETEGDHALKSKMRQR